MRIAMRRCWLIEVTSEAKDSDGFPRIWMQFAVLSDGSWCLCGAESKYYRSLNAPFAAVRQGLTYADFARAFAGRLY